MKTPATLVLLCLAATSQGAVREKQDFSADWQFLLADDAGLESPDYLEGNGLQSVRLPHTWNNKDTFDDVPGYFRGVGWYRKKFSLPAAWHGKRVVLRFEAACQVATVWVNDVLLGEHKGCFTPFEFDITRVVRADRQNLVAVRVDNRWRRDVPAYDMDFNVMGGLYREAWLVATDPVHIVSTRVTTPQVSDAEALAVFETEVRNESDRERAIEATTIIEGPDGASLPALSSPVRLKPGATIVVRQETRARSPRLWSPDNPQLYHATFTVRENGAALDDDQAPLGFRWYRFDADK